jgi:formate hydrogenlyase transcriptional activator
VLNGSSGLQGTLLLDEIGDLPPELQPKILRVLQKGQLERLGGAATSHTDERVICATHSADSFYRLSAPRLNYRHCIIAPKISVNDFAIDYAARMRKPIVAIEYRFMAAPVRHSWPGNFR